MCEHIVGVGEAVKGKNEKWLTGARYVRARDSALHPAEGATRPPNEKSAGERRKNWGAETENTQLFDLTRRDGKKATEHSEPPWADAKKTGERRRNREGFRNFAPQTGHAPSGADFRPHRSDRPPHCDETLPPRLSP